MVILHEMGGGMPADHIAVEVPIKYLYLLCPEVIHRKPLSSSKGIIRGGHQHELPFGKLAEAQSSFLDRARFGILDDIDPVSCDCVKPVHDVGLDDFLPIFRMRLEKFVAYGHGHIRWGADRCSYPYRLFPAFIELVDSIE